MHKRGLFDCRFPFCLFNRRSLGLRHWFDFHRPPTFCRTIECFDNAHVCDSLRARRFGPPIVKNTVGEIFQLGRKLISLAKGLLAGFALDRDMKINRIVVLVCLVESQVTFRGHHAVTGRVGRAEARGERCQSPVRKAQNRASHFVDFFEPLVLFAVAAESKNLVRFTALKT